MRAVRASRELFNVARHRIAYLQGITPRGTLDREADRALMFISIELSNCWANFSRALYFSVCANARDSSGHRIQTGMNLSTFDDAQYAAASRFTKRPLTLGKISHREEPDWKQKSTLLNLLDHVQASNLLTVSGALAYPGRVLSDLTTMRNFYAHRGKETARKASNLGRYYGLSGGEHPNTICLTRAPGRSLNVMQEWEEEMLEIVNLATQ